MKPITRNTLFYGDNLDILREYVPDESVDLIYLDPPFNSNRSYNVLFKEESGKDSEAQITAFEDTWHWGDDAQETFRQLQTQASDNVANMISSLREFIGANQMMAYLVMMTARLIELHRVLKPTGSIYLHCDPTASHYLKVVLDTIFGFENMLNEIIWKRTGAHSSAKRYGPVHDTILYYSRSSNYTWTNPRLDYEQEYLDKYYKYDDGDGRLYWRNSLTAAGIRKGSSGLSWRGFDPNSQGAHWKFTIENLERLDTEGKIYWPPNGGWPQIKRYRDELQGMAIPDMWDDIDKINPAGNERLGYPTQKPLALLERIVQASSKEGDIILDPFCGCGTAIAAAQKLNRRWIGIDVTHLSIALMKYRLKDSFGLQEKKDYSVIGEPESIGGARQLAQDDRYQFQWWAASKIQAKPLGGDSSAREGKKGSDKGIDAVINFADERDKLQRALVQVKSGHVSSRDIRDLRGTVEREGAAMGIFITLEEPTRDMVTEALSSDYYHSKIWQKDYPRIQILTIEQLLAGASVNMPPREHGQTFKQAEKIKKRDATQSELGI